MDDRTYCSEHSPDEPLRGTADVVDVWLLLEYRALWKAKAIAQSDLAAPTQDWIAGCVAKLADQGLRVRPQLIRQPELDRDDVRLLIAHGGRLIEFSGRGYDFLQELDLSGLADGKLPEGARVITEPRYFVCTNGQRDVCCSRFGLPVYTELRERLGDRVWQVSHLGGHRFAPNVLVLPQGVLYGRVYPELLDDFVDCVESGSVSFPQMRGRSCYPKHVQAAEALSGQPGLKLLHVDGDEHAATVTFAGRSESLKVSVRRSSEPLDVLSSCGADAAGPVYPYLAG
jgi:hypothetical protein